MNNLEAREENTCVSGEPIDTTMKKIIFSVFANFITCASQSFSSNLVNSATNANVFQTLSMSVSMIANFLIMVATTSVIFLKHLYARIVFNIISMCSI